MLNGPRDNIMYPERRFIVTLRFSAFLASEASEVDALKVLRTSV